MLSAGSLMSGPRKGDRMGQTSHGSGHDVWATFRLMVIGELLQHPPTVRGERTARLAALAAQVWTHPHTGAPVRFGTSTIARWYDRARQTADPAAALSRQVRCDRGTRRALEPAFAQVLEALYREHPQWTAQLLYDNACCALAQQGSDCRIPSYPTVRRFMRSQGLLRRRRLDGSGTDRARAAERRFVTRAVDRFEMSHVGALVHWDFHVGSCPVRDDKAGLIRPRLLAFLDDRSRVLLHAQWYTEETARVVAHAFMQASMKYGLPRAVLSDNGSAMRAAEIKEGFDRLSVAHRHTQVYSPYQNGKMECFWGSVEGRLLAMMGRSPSLDLAQLNRLTAIWIQEEYHRRLHASIKATPLERFRKGPTVLREPWPWASLEQAFTTQVTRRVRRTVGTVALEGKDFELPPAHRHHDTVTLRYARWDASRAWLCDPRNGAIIATLYPSDPLARSDGRRATRASPEAARAKEQESPQTPVTPPGGLPPLLEDLVLRHGHHGRALPLLTDRPPEPRHPSPPDEPRSPTTHPHHGDPS